jgi:hypothetical protein
VTAADGTTIAKESDGTKTGSQWTFGIIYHLEDGREIEAHRTHRRLRDAKESLAKLIETPEIPGGRYGLDVTFAEGEFIGTRHSFRTVDFLEALAST